MLTPSLYTIDLYFIIIVIFFPDIGKRGVNNYINNFPR